MDERMEAVRSNLSFSRRLDLTHHRIPRISATSMITPPMPAPMPMAIARTESYKPTGGEMYGSAEKNPVLIRHAQSKQRNVFSRQNKMFPKKS
jgi:hypothetical protein